jgi:hypothetical protein
MPEIYQILSLMDPIMISAVLLKLFKYRGYLSFVPGVKIVLIMDEKLRESNS